MSATAKIVDAAAGKAAGRSVEVAVATLEPDITTAEAQAETFTDQLSTFTTKYTGSANRQVNVRITTQYATNVLLAPGQEYNFDKQIGPRTEARGYKLAPGIVGPNTLEDVLGGGICQVSTTMFNAVFFAGLKVTERHNHSIYINHYPKGRDATVTGGGKNLRFVNDTGPLHLDQGDVGRQDDHHLHLRHQRRPQGDLHSGQLLWNAEPDHRQGERPHPGGGQDQGHRLGPDRPQAQDHAHGHSAGRHGHPRRRVDQRVADVPRADRGGDEAGHSVGGPERSAAGGAAGAGGADAA